MLQSWVFSQVTITAGDYANILAPGKSWQRYKNDNVNLTMDIGVSSNSQSQTWTAPVFIPSDSLRVDNLLPSSTPYAANFPGAMFCQKVALVVAPGLSAQAFQFGGFSNDTLFTFGSVVHYFGIINNQPVDTIVFNYVKQSLGVLPFQVGMSKIKSKDTTYSGTLMYIKTVTEIIDAFGTLVLPNGSFQALRGRTETRMDMYEGTNLLNSYSKYTFHWLTREGHQLDVNSDTSSSGTVKIKSIEVIYVITTPPTSVKNPVELPIAFALEQNYPNPFNPNTTIQYYIAKSEFVTLKVFDLLGREVATLVNEQKPPGTYQVKFDASKLSSGVYLYQLRAGAKVETKRMVLMR